MINLKTRNSIFEGFLEIEELVTIMDTILLLINLIRLMIYNFQSDSFSYISRANITQPIVKRNNLYFIKENYEENTSRIIQLVSYDLLRNEEIVLYSEPDGSTLPCIYYPDGGFCPEINVYQGDSLEYIEFEVYEMKEDATDEGDVYTFKIKVDNTGRLYFRIKNE